MSIRNFKLWNADKTSSFDFNQTGLTVTEPKGLGNSFTNTIQSGNRSRNYLTDQKNKYDDISFKIFLGLRAGNAYSLFNQLSIFIQSNGRNKLVLEYVRNDEIRYVDVVIKQVTKTEKTQFNVLEESIVFERLSPFYEYVRSESNVVLIQNDYFENILPKIILKDYTRGALTEIKVTSKNMFEFYDELPEIYQGVTFRIENVGNEKYLHIKGTPTVSFTKRISKVYALESNDYIVSGRVINNGSQSLGQGSISSSPNNHWDAISNIANGSSIKFNDSITNINVYLNTGYYFDFYVAIQLEKTSSNDIPIKELNGHSLNEVFEYYNLVINGSFKDGINNWGISMLESFNVINEIGNVLANQLYGSINQQISALANHKMFARANVKSDSSSVLLQVSENNSSVSVYNVKYHSGSDEWEDLYLMFYNNSDTIINGFGIQDNRASGWTTYYVDNAFLIDLTALGIDNLTVEQMEEYYNLYIQNIPTDYSKPSSYKQKISVQEDLTTIDEFTIDSENKEVTLNSEQAYYLLDKNNDTFLSITSGDFIIESDQPIIVEYKKWVID